MSIDNTGRYWVRDQKTGRVFCVEPVHERGDDLHADWAFKNKKPDLGAVRPEDSVITPKNGYTTIVTLPPGSNPMDYIEERLKDKLPDMDRE